MRPQENVLLKAQICFAMELSKPEGSSVLTVRVIPSQNTK